MPRSTPIYMIGDSHSIIFRDRLFALGDDLERTFVFRAKRFTFHANDAAAGDELGAKLIEALIAERLLTVVDGRLEASHRTDDPLTAYRWVEEGRERTTPLLVFTAGSLDANHVAFFLEADHIVLPDELERIYGDGDVAGARSMPYAEAVRLFDQTFGPLRAGLRRLRQLGFDRIAVLSLPPPLVDDEAYVAALATIGVQVPELKQLRSFRYAASIVANDVLRAIAADTGAIFVDRWDAQTVDGLAVPNLHWDFAHLQSWVADATAVDIIERFLAAEPPSAVRAVEGVPRLELRPLVPLDAASETGLRFDDPLAIVSVHESA